MVPSSRDEILFTLSTTSVTQLANFLGAIASVGSKCLVVINKDGAFFKINDLGICKVQLILDSNFFDSYQLEIQGDEDDVRFMIDIHSLVESVTIANGYNNGQLGDQAGPLKVNCILSYQGYGEPFVVSFEDEKMLERVEFQTFNIEDETEDEDDFEIENDKLILEIVLKSSILYEILKDFKEIQTEQVHIYCDTKNSAQNLIFISKGELGYSKMIFPSKRKLIEEMVIHKLDPSTHTYPVTNHDSATCCYNFAYFSKMIKLCRIGSKIKFKKDSNGITSILILLKDDLRNRSTTVIEFKLLESMNLSGDNNDTFNNSFIQNLIDDDEVTQIQVNVDDQQRLDDLLPVQNSNFNQDIDEPIFL